MARSLVIRAILPLVMPNSDRLQLAKTRSPSRNHKFPLRPNKRQASTQSELQLLADPGPWL